MKSKDFWGFDPFDADLFNPEFWRGRGPGKRRGRRSMFESGEIKFVILRLVKEQPRHGYDIMKALEEQMSGCYTPSAGTVYPTLQLLEDEGYVRVVEQDGKKIYHITPEGETYLEENKDELEQIIARVRDTVRDFTGGAMGDLHKSFGRVARATFGTAWRRGPEDPSVRAVADVLGRTADEIEQIWRGTPTEN